MCLAIPARLVGYVDDDRNYGTVELGGVRRRVNTSLLTGPDATEPGEFVLVHVGFALSRVSEEEASETLRILEQMGPAYEDEMQQIREWQTMEEELVGADYRASNGGPETGA